MTQEHLLRQQLIWGQNSSRVFISSGFGCPVGCIYCYIYEDGYSFSPPVPGKLSGEELEDYFLSNRRFKIGRYGTIITFGCTSDPFHPAVEIKTLEYIRGLSNLGNPMQFATKFPLSKTCVKVISQVSNPIYPMISICSLENAKLLEPAAPSTETRLSMIKHLTRIGFKTTLFYKPVIPGINDHEHESIISSAIEYEAKFLVAGITYVNENLMKKFVQKGFDVNKISRRGIDKRQLIWMKNKISFIRSHDILDSIVRKARKSNLKAFKNSICVIAEDLGVQCPTQKLNPEFCSGHSNGHKKVEI